MTKLITFIIQVKLSNPIVIYKKYSVLTAVFTALIIITFLLQHLFVVGIIKSISLIIHGGLLCFFLYFVFAALMIWVQAGKEVWTLREDLGIANQF